jgi:4-amino-4-deoxy-L-arabinose transferase-like glycosyltransferase
VTQTDNAPISTSVPILTARLAWILLILATLYICYFRNLGAIGLVGPDEPRYAWIARAMVETGDWVTPRLYGQPWFEKPVLYYWGAALSFKLFGVSEAAARLPSAVAALLATLALAWLAGRIYGAETARWLLLLLPTTVGMIGFSHAAATDMPFAAMLTIAMVCAAFILKLVRDENTSLLARRPWLALLLLGFFLGLAVLAKGPAAIVLSGGAVLFWAIFTGRWRDAFRCLHLLAIAGFCLTALPWYFLCAHRNPEFFRIFIIEHNFKRYLTPEFQHIQPFWFYVPVILVAFMPWTLALLWSVEFGFRRERQALRFSPAAVLLLTWSAFCLVFFSISKSKLPGYILPAVPPIGLLLVRSCIHLAPQNSRPFRWIRFGFYFLGLPVAVALGWMSRYSEGESQTQKMIAAALAALLLGLTNWFLANLVSSNRFLRKTAALSVVPILIILSAFQWFAPAWLPADPSAKPLALIIDDNRSPLASSRFFLPPTQRSLKYGLSFYLHREVPLWDPSHPQEGLLLLQATASTLDCEHHLPAGWNCAPQPIEFELPSWVAYRVQPAKGP